MARRVPVPVTSIVNKKWCRLGPLTRPSLALSFYKLAALAKFIFRAARNLTEGRRLGPLARPSLALSFCKLAALANKNWRARKDSNL